MNSREEPRPEVLEYGFLTSRAERALVMYREGSSLDNENTRVLCDAVDFMDKLLVAQAMMTGQLKGLTPTMDGLSAFRYGIQAMIDLKKRDQGRSPETLAAVHEMLSGIKDTLSQALKSPAPSDSQLPALLAAADFFGALADGLSALARQCFLSNPTHEVL